MAEEPQTRPRRNASRPARDRRSSARRPGEHHGDLRRALLAAGIAEVESLGSEGLALRAVARRAGVSAAAPYHHFGSREGLLAAIAQDGFERLATELAHVRAESASARLRRMAAAYTRFALSRSQHYRVMFEPLAEAHWRHADLARTAGSAFDMLVAAVAAALPASRRARAPELAVAAWALVHGVATLGGAGVLAPVGGPADAEGLSEAAGAAVVALVRGARSD